MRKKQLIMIAVIILLVAAISLSIYWLFFRPKNNTNTNEQQTPIGSNLPEAKIVSNIDDKTLNQANSDSAVAAASESERQSASFSLVARNFVERFGTYSSQSDSSGLADLKLMSTSKLATWLETEFGNRAKNRVGGYYSVANRVISIKTLSGSESDAKSSVLVETQKTETKTDGQTNVGSQSVKIDLVKTDGEWLVDGVYWQ